MVCYTDILALEDRLIDEKYSKLTESTVITPPAGTCRVDKVSDGETMTFRSRGQVDGEPCTSWYFELSRVASSCHD